MVDNIDKKKFDQKEHKVALPHSGDKKNDLSEILRKWVEKGKIIIELGGKEYGLETTSYDFEYPERIQKETGILWYKRIEISNDTIDNFKKKYGNLRDILYSISNGEYPNRSFVHEMWWYYDKNDCDKFREVFSKSKFFLQKIYDLEYIKDKQMNFNKSTGYWSYITVFNTQTGEMVGHVETNIADLAKEEYYTGIKNKKLFACTTNSGFNVAAGDSFFKSHVSFSNKNIFVGYPMNEDSFFYKYLYKALEIYVNKLKGIDFKKIYHSNWFGLGAIIQEIILCNPEVQKNIFYSNENSKGRMVLRSSYNNPERIQSIIKLGMNIIHKLEIKFNMNFNNFFTEEWWKSDIINRIIHAGKDLEGYELGLPIFIGLDSIPQLSWGHAEYAHYMNEKGLNFFKFKHADHLPAKE